MAAHAYQGPVAVHEAVAPPALSAKVAPVAVPAPASAQVPAQASRRKEEDISNADQDDEEGGVWDSASLYEEILDDVEAFEYSSDSAPAICVHLPL